ncbi:MAG: monofunctional biosynthetic peptidoglycan transglycosylase [Acidobacteriota bacterium]
MAKRAGKRIRQAILWLTGLFFGLHVFFALCLVGLKFVDPFTTGVQAQRRVESWFASGKYQKKQTWLPLARISPQLQHAVIAAEDGRFYQTYGIDWQQVEIVMQESLEEGEIPRGASTITQQLVKNLFFTTHRNPARKVLEYTLAPMASVILGKQRVLELYLNIVEWGPGVWGAEAAAKFHYGTTAARLSREQGARLAACLPNPRRRRAPAMNRYSAII